MKDRGVRRAKTAQIKEKLLRKIEADLIWQEVWENNTGRGVGGRYTYKDLERQYFIDEGKMWRKKGDGECAQCWCRNCDCPNPSTFRLLEEAKQEYKDWQAGKLQFDELTEA